MTQTKDERIAELERTLETVTTEYLKHLGRAQRLASALERAEAVIRDVNHAVHNYRYADRY